MTTHHWSRDYFDKVATVSLVFWVAGLVVAIAWLIVVSPVAVRWGLLGVAGAVGVVFGVAGVWHLIAKPR